MLKEDLHQVIMFKKPDVPVTVGLVMKMNLPVNLPNRHEYKNCEFV